VQIKGNVSFVLPHTLQAVVLFFRPDIYCVYCAKSKKVLLLRCQLSGLILFSVILGRDTRVRPNPRVKLQHGQECSLLNVSAHKSTCVRITVFTEQQLSRISSLGIVAVLIIFAAPRQKNEISDC